MSSKKMRQRLLGAVITIAILTLACAQAQLVEAHSSQHHDHQSTDQVLLQPVGGGKISSFGANPVPTRPVRHVHSDIRYVDLSHPLHNGTLHWPKNRGIQVFMDIDSETVDPRGNKYHVRSDSVIMAMHVGTHLDAPSHFSKDGWSIEKIPLERLIEVPLTVVDLSEKVEANRSYSFLKSDFLKDAQPLVKPNSVVLVYTGISKFYDDSYRGYIGTEKNSSIALMKSPGFSSEAAQYLADLGVYGVGLDAISADSSERQADESRYDPQAHVTFNTRNVYILENVSKNLKQLVGEPSARLTIAPLPVVGGTGSPVRLVATIGHEDHHDAASHSNGATGQSPFSLPKMLLALSLCVLAVTI